MKSLRSGKRGRRWQFYYGPMPNSDISATARNCTRDSGWTHRVEGWGRHVVDRRLPDANRTDRLPALPSERPTRYNAGRPRLSSPSRGGPREDKQTTMIINDTEFVDLTTPTGPMRTHVFRPAAEGRYPGILLFSEIFQVSGPIR